MASRKVLYVHVADDGGLFVIDGKSGRSAWVTEAELSHRVDAVREIGGAVLLSQDRGLPLATAVIESITASRVPIVLASEIHRDAIRREGLTALMSSAYLGDVEVVADLIRRGVDVQAQDSAGYTALMYAANGGQNQTAKLLIDTGADVDQADGQGSTALMFAAQHGHLTIVKRLLVAGADPQVRRTTDGLAAGDFAASNGHDRVAAALAAAAERRAS